MYSSYGIKLSVLTHSVDSPRMVPHQAIQLCSALYNDWKGYQKQKQKEQKKSLRFLDIPPIYIFVNERELFEIF